MTRLVWPLILILGACSSAPVAPLPAPFPEASAWVLPSGGGAFLGLHVEANEGGSLESLDVEDGVRVLRVVENSPAARAGLRHGDVLLRFDGATVSDPGALDVLLARAQAGADVALAVRRDDTVFELNTRLGGVEADGVAAPLEAYVVDPARTRAGWATTPAGVVLAALAEDAALAAQQVPLGSVLVSLDGEAVLSARGLVRRVQALDPGARVTLQLRQPGGEARELVLRLHDVPRRITRSAIPVLWEYEAEPDGSSIDFHLLDFWFLELFQYHRRGVEREWVLLELFGWELFPFATGVGELSE